VKNAPCIWPPRYGAKDRIMGTLVNYTTDKGVALLTLNDPPVNAYTHEMFRELDNCVLEARFDNDVHVLVLIGHGDKYFSAGANINMLREADAAFKYYFCLHANETLSRLEQTPKLCIAAINGHALGGGLEVALACDLRVAREGGYQIGLPDVNMGLLPGFGGTQRLARLVGGSRAIEMMVEASSLSVEAAHAQGIVNKVWIAPDHEAFLRRVIAYAHEFTPPNKAATAVGRLKRSVQTGLECGLEQGLALERELLAALFASEDAKEGLVAFTQQRKPTFVGR
jgi:enoyl-CoA hydratase/carnithine racemase